MVLWSCCSRFRRVMLLCCLLNRTLRSESRGKRVQRLGGINVLTAQRNDRADLAAFGLARCEKCSAALAQSMLNLLAHVYQARADFIEQILSGQHL